MLLDNKTKPEDSEYSTVYDFLRNYIEQGKVDMPLSQIPIKKLPLSEQEPFIKLVDQILAAKKKDPSTDTSALEKQIYEIVYALYGLTPEEIALVEGKK